MQRWWRLLAVTALFSTGCEPMTPSGDPLSPVRIEAPRPAAPPAAPAPEAAPGEPVADGDFDFEGEERPEDVGATERMDPIELQARHLGIDPALLRQGQAPAPAPAPTTAPQAPVAPTIGEWDPSQPLDSSFGVRLLATLHDVQPPRAVLGLSDGSEQVVQPGAFLADERIVVMAIGRDVVQLARVTPQGFYAKVDTQNLQALFPHQRPQPMP